MMGSLSAKMSESYWVMCPLSMKKTFHHPGHSWVNRVALCHLKRACTITRSRVSFREKMIKMKLYALQITFLARNSSWRMTISRKSIKSKPLRCSQVSWECFMKCYHAHVTFSVWRESIANAFPPWKKAIDESAFVRSLRLEWFEVSRLVRVLCASHRVAASALAPVPLLMDNQDFLRCNSNNRRWTMCVSNYRRVESTWGIAVVRTRLACHQPQATSCQSSTMLAVAKIMV